MASGVPDYFERKGSLFLRADHMNYGRATKNSNWAQAREAEPKDYDISLNDERNLRQSTYNRIGTFTDGKMLFRSGYEQTYYHKNVVKHGSIPATTYQELTSNSNLKREFAEQEVRKPMVNLETLDNVDMDREIGAPKHGFGSVLPRHNPDYNKYYLDTTHKSDFKPPNPDYQPVPECLPDFGDQSAAHRKCNSQFTDTSDYRRPGRNTWQDESGIYNNTHYKREVHKSTETIPPQLF